MPCRVNQNRHAQIVFVAGFNRSMQLGVASNNQPKDCSPIVCPPMKSFTDGSSLLSYSIYENHAVVVTKDGRMMAIGDIQKCQICSDLPKEINEFTDFSIVKYILNPISAVCYGTSTAYMLSNTRRDSNCHL